MKRPDPIRQSYLARADNCMLSLKLDLQSKQRSPSVLAARGALFHMWAARAFEMLRERGESRMPVEVGLELLHDVCAQRDIPSGETIHLPMAQAEWLRILVTRWCETMTIPNPSRIVAIEQQFIAELDVPGPNGQMYKRAISGRPDVLIADPPDGMIVPDLKTGWMPPAVQRDGQPERDDRLSDHGYAQQVIYGLLILLNFPAVERVILREHYIMFGEWREATLHRWKIERYSDLVSELVARIDAALDEGPRSKRWFPTAGVHCSICPDPLRCPIRKEAHVPVTEDDVQRIMREWHVSAERRKRLAPMLKAWVDVHGPLEIDHGKGRRMVGWAPNKDGAGRSFRIYEPDESAPQNPYEARLEDA